MVIEIPRVYECSHSSHGNYSRRLASHVGLHFTHTYFFLHHTYPRALPLSNSPFNITALSLSFIAEYFGVFPRLIPPHLVKNPIRPRPPSSIVTLLSSVRSEQNVLTCILACLCLSHGSRQTEAMLRKNVSYFNSVAMYHGCRYCPALRKVVT